MPTYLPAVSGISLSEALAEAATIAPNARGVYHTFEIFNDALSSPLRLVRNTANISVKLESTARFNPGSFVTCHAAGVEAQPLQESSEASSPQIQVMLSNVNGEISELLKLSRGTFFEWGITERIYVSDDLTAPARMPVTTLTILSIEMDGSLAKLTCGFGESSKSPVPRNTYRIKEYPGLAAK